MSSRLRTEQEARLRTPPLQSREGSDMATLNATLRARPYAGPTDLPALLALWPACRPAGWATDFPSPADLVELLAAPEVAARTQDWEDAAGQVAANALVDSYNSLWFDWAPEVTAGAGVLTPGCKAVNTDLHSVSISRDARGAACSDMFLTVARLNAAHFVTMSYRTS
jgi:hypothetical protein